MDLINRKFIRRGQLELRLKNRPWCLIKANRVPKVSETLNAFVKESFAIKAFVGSKRGIIKLNEAVPPNGGGGKA